MTLRCTRKLPRRVPSSPPLVTREGKERGCSLGRVARQAAPEADGGRGQRVAGDV
jgi:hypothetical protein